MKSDATFHTALVQEWQQAGANEILIAQYWLELQTAYNGKGRHYHTLTHLENLYCELQPLQLEINDPGAVLLAIAWHDIVYNVRKKDSEEKSATLATSRMQTIGYATDRINQVEALILATKQHGGTGNSDIDLFTDADLSILGASQDRYAAYCKQVRREYRIYPDFLYRPGRKKVLEHFLSMPRIYKSTYFYAQYEDAARSNIATELSALSR